MDTSGAEKALACAKAFMGREHMPKSKRKGSPKKACDFLFQPAPKACHECGVLP